MKRIIGDRFVPRDTFSAILPWKTPNFHFKSCQFIIQKGEGNNRIPEFFDPRLIFEIEIIHFRNDFIKVDDQTIDRKIFFLNIYL